MNNRIKIVADDKIPFLKGILEPYCYIEYYPGNQIDNAKILDADALIIRTRTNCNSELLDGSKVKLIATATIGYDHIDTEYCDRKNIKWLNAPGCNSVSVKQYITAAILFLVQKEKFNPTEKTIGIVGVGNVGSKVNEVAQILGMKILLNDPPRQRSEGKTVFCNLSKIMEESDIITFHVPLNREGIDKTYHLADEDFFNQIEKKPIIINSSRGEVIKTSALKNAINTGKISKTAFDVWEGEPDIDLELLNKVDIATPHIAGYSADGKANGTSVCVNEVNRFYNLGLRKNWYPAEIPTHNSGHKIIIDCKGKSDLEIIREAVFFTYYIADDDYRLRSSPDTFEKQRETYPIRREFNCFKIVLQSCITNVNDKLERLGFTVLSK